MERSKAMGLVWVGLLTLIFGTFLLFVAGQSPSVMEWDLSAEILVLGLLFQVGGFLLLGYIMWAGTELLGVISIGALGFVLWGVLIILLFSTRSSYLSTFASILSGILIATASSEGLLDLSDNGR